MLEGQSWKVLSQSNMLLREALLNIGKSEALPASRARLEARLHFIPEI